MVAVIHASSSLRNAVNYNEQKVKAGKASCLAAENYPKDADKLNVYQKLARLQNVAALNQRTKVNSVHISLNFDPSEKLSEEKLRRIASAYLDKIGFGEQPYLVYLHRDAGHPHIHIVTTNIRANGKRIELHNLGKTLSEKARKEVEQTFGLVQAAGKKEQQNREQKPAGLQPMQYGKGETKRAITNVLDAVLNTYRYTSLPELNAVLMQHKVLADPGSKDSRTYQKGGLTYRMLDEKGAKVGVPIKASTIYSKPTLKHLQQRFRANEILRHPHKVRIKNAIDLALLKNRNQTFPTLVQALHKERIDTVIRQNEQGIVYGLTYVDHQTKTVFNGSDLGKAYSAKGLLERCSQIAKPGPGAMQAKKEGQHQNFPPAEAHRNADTAMLPHSLSSTSNAVNDLLQPAQVSPFVPHQLGKGKKKKQRRKSINL